MNDEKRTHPLVWLLIVFVLVMLVDQYAEAGDHIKDERTIVMMSLPQIAAAVTAVGTIGGAGIYLDNAHVASEDFRQYIEQQREAGERDYVRDLKEDIREVRLALISHPGDPYLIENLEGLMDELCELRPDDRMCME